MSQHWIDCPHCGDRFGIQVPPPAVHSPTSLTAPKTRPGGRQVSLGRGLRSVAAGLYDDGYVASEAQALRLARRWLGRALPARQRAPRERRTDLRDAA